LNIKGFIVSDYLGDRNWAKLLEQLSDAAQSERIEIDSNSEIVFNMKSEGISSILVKNVGLAAVSLFDRLPNPRYKRAV
jgi:hypothetical protein